MNVFKTVEESIFFLENIIKKLQELGVDAQICKRSPLPNEIISIGESE